MADAETGEKTEDPTGKRISDASNKGQVASSQEIPSLGVFIVIAILVPTILPSMMSYFYSLNRKFIENAHAFVVGRQDFEVVFREVIFQVGIYALPIMIVFLITGFVIQVIQVGWNPSFEKFQIKLDKFSPAKGIKKIIGVRALVEAAKGIAKIGIIGSVIFILVMPLVEDVELLPAFDLMHVLDRIKTIVLVVLAITILIMTIIAALDFAYQKWDHKNKLKMTKQEVKDERRQQDGDPLIKQRIAALRIERQRERMMQAVGKADVIITNPTHYAIALQYDMDKMPAPILVGKGVDEIAARIREVAEQNEIPIVENPPLARALYAAVEIDEEIPQEHYHAVAEVIGYVYRLKGRVNNLDEKESWAG
ncbi:MAG: flagellar biosynthesis protein FlhB [Rhodospirillaceae bacterium]|nr:flagellar biosynthesis protein FlhB [Rhodospirillaceae bacterium]